MVTKNSIGSNIPIDISKGGTNASSMTTTDGVVYYDGTRLVTTTVGTATQVLTSNGAGVAPTFQAISSSSSFLTKKTTLTSSQIKALNATPIQMVAAQGANTVIVPISTSFKFIYGGSNVFVAGAAQTIDLYFSNSPGKIALPIIINATLVGNQTKFSIIVGDDQSRQSTGIYDNVGLFLVNPVATEISGNAANDNQVVVFLTYYIADVS